MAGIESKLTVMVRWLGQFNQHNSQTEQSTRKGSEIFHSACLRYIF